MVKVILYIAMSLDGYIATSDGGVAWLDRFNGSGDDYGYEQFLSSVSTVVMGKTTYEQVKTFGEYPYKNKKSFVFSHEDRGSDELVSFVAGSPKAFLSSLPADEVVWLVGGAHLANQFIAEDLVNTFIIFTMPVLLGSGIALFSKQEKKDVSLIFSKTYPSGVIEAHYEMLS